MTRRKSATSNVAAHRQKKRPTSTYRRGVPSNKPSPRGEQFAQFIRDARSRAGIPQDTLAERAGVNRTTIIRWESGAAERPDPEQVRRVCAVLGVDPRWAAVALGYLTDEEVRGTGHAPLSLDIEEVLTILQDPAVPPESKNEWVQYLKYLYIKARRTAG